MQHIRAWRRPGGGGGSGGGDGGGEGTTFSGDVGNRLGAARLTEMFVSVGRLDYQDKFEDGFRDVSSVTNSISGSRRQHVEVVVDRHDDPVLTEFVDRAAKKLLRANDTVTRVMVASLLVSEALGRSGDHASDLCRLCDQLLVDRADPKSGAVRLGDLMPGPREAGGLGTRKSGAGKSSHRAILLKAIADWLGIAPCSLVRGGVGGDGAGGAAGVVTATYCTVLIDGEPFVVDVMFDPGALYEHNSSKAAEYIRRLESEHSGQTKAVSTSIVSVEGIAGRRAMPRASGGIAVGGTSGATAPSMQQNLDGRMVRPSWHVEPWEVEFDRRDRAGRGGFGEVFKGVWAGQPVAVKEVRDASPTDGDVCDFILEISLLSRLSHPNVVRFWRGCADVRSCRRTLILVTEWMDRGVLSSLLHESQEPALSFGQVTVLAMGIGRGIAFLHQVKILHLDLKSPNVLLDSTWQTKLCDFGLAKLREQTALHTTLRGVSPIWAPPELFDDRGETGGGEVTEKADVYSFGIIVFELTTRSLPFSDVSQMQLPRVKTRGQLPKFPEDMDGNMRDLVKLCLTHKPTGRPTMFEALEQVEQIAQRRGIDLQEEQAQMEHDGLHFESFGDGCRGGVGGGAASSVEQVRRAEADRRRAEMEVARLKNLLQEEDAKVQKLELVRRGGNAAAAAEATDIRNAEIQFCERHTQAVGDVKFRCALCRKLFRGPEFVHKHLLERHSDDLLASLGAGTGRSAGAETMANQQEKGGEGSDWFFDEDIAEESNPRLYTAHLRGPASSSPGGGGADGGCGGLANSSFSQALQDAAEAGDVGRLQQCLLQGGVSLDQVDVDGGTPLQIAAKCGNVEAVRYILSNSADVGAADEAGLTALHAAAQDGHIEVCELLLHAGSRVDADSGAKARTALHLAAANGHREVCAALLLNKAGANILDGDGESALHKAARFGDREVCEVILSWGGDVGATDNEGWSPLHEAARWGDAELVESLLQRGADARARSNDGEFALHVVPGGYADLAVVDVLLQWRCDVDCRDFDGEAPLHVAVRLGDAELAGALLSQSADANATNNSGATPLDFAKRDEIRWLLRSHKGRKGAGAC
eukprot:TRINITY_DN1712_c0_g4_i1.p1 TRINITY_DN1712_c0_g4~~TRINITY_DN1712_c0_g4_i1.p1  ORF type:complete len:1097 (+),score=221.02 TRINITY_DN1712_c0_g4_i1:195-3485(+)